MSTEANGEHGGAVVPVRADAMSGELFPLAPDEHPMRFWANFSTEDMAGKALVMKCFGASDVRIDGILGETVELHQFLLHPVQLVNKESGEVSDAVRAAFVLSDGRMLSTCSAGAIRGLKLLCGMCGTGPWSPPLKVRFKQVETRAGRRTYNLELVVEAVAPKGKGK